MWLHHKYIEKHSINTSWRSKWLSRLLKSLVNLHCQNIHSHVTRLGHFWSYCSHPLNFFHLWTTHRLEYSACTFAECKVYTNQLHNFCIASLKTAVSYILSYYSWSFWKLPGFILKPMLGLMVFFPGMYFFFYFLHSLLQNYT